MDAGLWAKDAARSEHLDRGVRQDGAGAASRVALFDALFARYRSAILAYVLHLLSNRTDAEDVTQETFLKLYLQLRRTPDLDARPWLYRVATNACIDLLRTKRRTDGQNPSHYETRLEGALDDTNPEKVQLRQEQSQQIRRALKRLPAAYQQVLILRQMHGLSYSEIAEVLGISVEAVTSLLHRARLAFRSTYTSAEGEASHREET